MTLPFGLDLVSLLVGVALAYWVVPYVLRLVAR